MHIILTGPSTAPRASLMALGRGVFLIPGNSSKPGPMCAVSSVGGRRRAQEQDAVCLASSRDIRVGRSQLDTDAVSCRGPIWQDRRGSPPEYLLDLPIL